MLTDPYAHDRKGEENPGEAPFYLFPVSWLAGWLAGCGCAGKTAAATVVDCRQCAPIPSHPIPPIHSPTHPQVFHVYQGHFCSWYNPRMTKEAQVGAPG